VPTGSQQFGRALTHLNLQVDLLLQIIFLQQRMPIKHFLNGIDIAEPFLRNHGPLMAPEGLVSCSQESLTGPCLEPDELNALPISFSLILRLFAVPQSENITRDVENCIISTLQQILQ
jgi:hypothetical protein